MAKSNGPQLDVLVNAKTEKFSNGMKKAKADLKDFEKVSKGSLDSISNALGIPTDKIKQMQGAARELGKRFEESENAGVKAFGNLLKGCNGLAAGIAGLGIAGAVTAFKALKAEAENFSNTIDGLNFKMQTETWLSTYKQAMHDANAETGHSFGQLLFDIEKAWTDIGSQVGGLFANGMDFGKMRSDRAGARANANDAAYAAYYLADAQKELLKNDKALADLETKIAAARLEAYDTKNPEAIANLTDLINQRYAIQEPILRQIYDSIHEINQASGNTVQDTEKENAAYRALTSLAAQRDNDLKSLLRLQKSITAEVTTQVEKTDQWADIIKDLQGALAADRADLNMWGIQEALNKPAGITAGATTQAGLTLPVHPVVDKQEIEEFVIDFSNLLEDAFSSTGEALGGLMSDLMTGGDAFKNFGNSAVAALGDMAISVGKLAISTGVATLGIKTALESLNGYVAIAAGTALVALGTAVKGSLSSVANGGSYGGSVASSSYSGPSRGDVSREITVNVTGTLKANGNVLEAVLDSNRQRKLHTV